MLHAKLGTVKDRNSKDIAKAKEIKQEYTEEMYKKVLNYLDSHVARHLEADILE